MLRATRTVSAVWFRRHIRPVELSDHRDDTWDAAEASLLSYPPEARRIDELAVELAEVGFQREVVVGRHRWWHRHRRVFDGMHRSIAAMRLGIDIPIRRDYAPDSDWDVDVYRVTSAGTDNGDLLDATMSLSSFRCSAGPWIQCDGAFANPTIGVEMNLPRHPTLRPLIATELADRLRSGGVEAQVAFLEELEFEDE